MLLLVVGRVSFSWNVSHLLRAAEPVSGVNQVLTRCLGTSEGIDVTHSLEYYGRMLFTLHLLPLLRASAHGRVLTILAGHMVNSNRFNTEDLTLDAPGAFGPVSSQSQMAGMNTLGFNQLTADPKNGSVVFIHEWPGMVNTGNMARYWKREKWWQLFPLTNLLLPGYWLVGMSTEEARRGNSSRRRAERSVVRALSWDGVQGAENTVGTKTGGLYLLDDKGSASVYNKTELKKLEARGQDKAWAKTKEILKPFL